jgi:TonB-dependent starch-binding outer membrane protein SusC
MRKNLIFFDNVRKGLSTSLLFALLFITGLFSDFGAAKAQGDVKQITGKIVDMNNLPLPGVTILIKGTSKGAVSDLEGAFTLNASPSDKLVISYIGYLTEEMSVTDQTNFQVSLSEDIIGLNEVVVTGYGMQKKSDLTGAIASVSGEALAEMPVATIDQAMQGKAAGVNIISKSGRPGEGSTIQIRGISSINGIEPLIILDGAPVSSTILSSLNSSDIESIEVLKDASSAAIYGATGGNGVIIITSKKGQAGKMVTNFNFYRGVEKALTKIDMMNSEDWMAFYEEANPKKTVAATGRPDTIPTYDWQSYAFKPAISQNFDISFQGGSDKSNFLVSASYNDQEGIIRNSDYTRWNLRVNSEHKIAKRITVDEKIFYITSERNGFADHLWHEYYDGPIRPCFLMAPYIPDYLPNGDWANPEDMDSIYGVNSTGNNPLAKMDMIDRKERNNVFDANLGVKIDLVKGLSFTSRFDAKIDMVEIKEFQDAYWNTTEDRRTENEIKLLQSFRKNKYYTAQQLLNYNLTLANAHNFNLMAGMEAYNYEWYNMEGERNRMPSPDENLLYFEMSPDDTSSNQVIDGTGDKERALSYFGRLNYDYKGKYLLTASIRRDGRSSFGPDKRWGNFPSISLGWKFSEENFIKNNLPILSFGKIRYGYGETGSYAKTGAPYLSLIRTPMHFAYPFDNIQSSTGAAPVQLENPEIHWETVITNNFGIDLAFLNNKLNFTAEYYSKVNEGMIAQQEVTYIAGTYTMGRDVDGDVTNPEVNIGSIKNSGFEFQLGYRKMEGDLKGSFDINMATLKNKVLDLATDSIMDGAVHSINRFCLTREGGAVSEFYGWQIDGMFQADDPKNDKGVFTNQPYKISSLGDTTYAMPKAKAGDVQYQDLDGDGKVLGDGDKVSLGSPLPKLTYGFSINLEYKGFDFSASFNGTIGNKIFNGSKQYLYYYQGATNHCKDFANRYVENDITKTDPVTGEQIVVVHANRNTDIPRNEPNNYAKANSFYIENGSYLRLRNVTLGYTIPQKYTKKVNIEKFRIYVGGRNLLTFTKYKGMNPESGFYDNITAMGIDIGVYPVTKMYLFGANITF